ncbi:AcrR family transcriptional regulator [Thermocatellispora tengchongensis]|uniref:AcrR family transcriptional regulator n=1 Tax=Thermocatellispora tengchongensis TaxID=1073253 RepID=A0A840PPT8_9ACTN|nr:TetR family transcriptional regulator [Thermocatellispora tengchongensis]MBB5140083.1 AcrR family transcriptional regulator [Thermocatellispora tengchongensis]
MTEIAEQRPRAARTSGRRTGSPQTRAAILDAAMRSFADKGYPGTTIRAVARAAGVDPALVMHFFGSKDGLFVEAIRTGLPVREMHGAIDGDPAGLGERLVRRYLGLWEDPATGWRMYALLHSAASAPPAADLIRNFMVAEMLIPMTRYLRCDHAETRALLAASQLVGLGMVRYALKIEPLSALPREQLIACVAPTLQRYLTGDLPLTG